MGKILLWSMFLLFQTYFTVSSIVVNDLVVLSHHEVEYSEPQKIPSSFQSSSFHYNPKSMTHLYTFTRLFNALLQRNGIFPSHWNESEILSSPLELLQNNWGDLLLQYIGVITLAVFGLLAAITIPICGLSLFCCRCFGKCGSRPEPFDKKSDGIKRIIFGVLLSFLVIGALFGVISAFVTNLYSHNGLVVLPERYSASFTETSLYFDNTKKEVTSLLETNFAELEEVLVETIDESGLILKKSLAEVTQAVAIDDLSQIASSLSSVKTHLRDIHNSTIVLQGQIGQLRLGLNGTKVRLLQALHQCFSSSVCSQFFKDYNIDSDLILTDRFESFSLPPDIESLISDISHLLNNDIESKVKIGQRQLDNVKDEIDKSIRNLRPSIKAEIRKMGQKLMGTSYKVKESLEEIDKSLKPLSAHVSQLSSIINEYGDHVYYIGLGMSILLLLIVTCFICGLFYGFCGKRPGNVYGDDCCNTGTGSNWLLSAVYLTFLFSFILLFLTSCEFVIGTTSEKIICESFKYPKESQVLRLLELQFVKKYYEDSSLASMILQCHANQSLYQILNFSHKKIDVESLRNWRSDYDIGALIDNIKDSISLKGLTEIEILSPAAQSHLEALASSSFSDINFTMYTTLVENQITAIELPSFTRRLRQVRERINRVDVGIAAALENEALFLDQMSKVVVSMKVSLRKLKAAIEALQKEAHFNYSSLRDAVTQLILKVSQATTFLRTKGPQIVEQLAARYSNETMSLIDGYVERVVNKTQFGIGKCGPLSTVINATIESTCTEVIDPFNGFWASVGICYVFFLPSLVLAMSLVSLYKKSEAYPGPLMESGNLSTLPLDSRSHHNHNSSDVSSPGNNNNNKKKNVQRRNGHRRNPSEYLPDSAHYRAGYSYQNRFQDVAQRTYESEGGPPRYTSNPNLNLRASIVASAPPSGEEFERPPPYYYPGPNQVTPPPLPTSSRPKSNLVLE